MVPIFSEFAPRLPGIAHPFPSSVTNQKSGQVVFVGGQTLFAVPLDNNIPMKINNKINTTTAIDNTITRKVSIIHYLNKLN
jgi:hypothetical protein